MKVDFIIIGAQKCATTSLAYQLRQHPQVCFAKRKEPHYFSKVDDWHRHLPSYHRLFSPRPGQLCGEASTSYTFLPEYPHTSARLFAYNPEAKLIYLMRDPIKRIESHYAHRVLHGRVTQPLEAEVLANPIYLDRSCYATQVEAYLQYFPRTQLLLLVFEEYVADIPGTLETVARFLGISPGGFAGIDITPQKVSYRRVKPAFRFLRKVLPRTPPLLQRVTDRWCYYTLPQRPVCPEPLTSVLWRRLEDDVARIEDLLGHRLTVWRRGYQ
ncbi:MAG: sulfotransferase domain-containing protein [Candidatus Binatia bacterium]|nr:sulfotransferase domain-containing protein [Candidatus Binatia bacterium]